MTTCGVPGGIRSPEAERARERRRIRRKAIHVVIAANWSCRRLVKDRERELLAA